MKIIMIGHGMVGHKFIESVLEHVGDDVEITILAEEPRLAYDRVHLTEYFSGKSAKDLTLCRADFADAYGIDLRLNTKAVAIDQSHKTVTTNHGDVLSFDKLILATGSYAFVPPISGNDRENCFVYRTIEDLDAIRAASLNAKSGVVIGGGLLGLEAAKALRDLNLETHVVEFAPRLMAVQIDDLGGKVLRAKIENLGVKVHTQKATSSIEEGTATKHVMKFGDGSELETDIILFSAGIRPRDELARQSGLALGERGGIMINDYCQTSNPDIYAIGECALWQNKIYGLVAPGYDMARIAAKHITEQACAEFAGADMSTKLKLMGVDVASVGDAHAMTPNALSYFYADEDTQVYKKIVVNSEKTKLLGAVLVGCAKEYNDLLQMMLNGLALPENPESLIMPGYAQSSSKSGGSGVDLLPDSAKIGRASCRERV